MRCRRRDGAPAPGRCIASRRFLFTCQTAQSSSFPPRVAAPGFFVVSFASLRRMGGATATPIAGPCGTGFDGFRARRSTHPTNSYLSFLRSRDIRARVLFPFLPSQLPIPDRGDGGAPGGGILSPVAPVIARRHVCEAWAVPRNRNGASRRSTVTVLGPSPRSATAELPPLPQSGPEPPGHGLRTAAGTPPPAPPSGSSPETPLDERDVRVIA